MVQVWLLGYSPGHILASSFMTRSTCYLRPLKAGVPAPSIADWACVHSQPYSEHEAKAAFSRMLSHHKRNGW